MLSLAERLCRGKPPANPRAEKKTKKPQKPGRTKQISCIFNTNSNINASKLVLMTILSFPVGISTLGPEESDGFFICGQTTTAWKLVFAVQNGGLRLKMPLQITFYDVFTSN
jgi:hypothetical protein